MADGSAEGGGADICVEDAMDVDQTQYYDAYGNSL